MVKYTAAIIGCGNIGGGYPNGRDGTPFTHAGAYSLHGKFRLVAACDSDRGRLQKFGRRWKVGRLYADAEEMLHCEKPDVVSICTPTRLHYQHLLAAARHSPKAIICEKPISDREEGAAEMVAVCSRRKIALFCNYFRRFMPSMNNLKKLIASGKYGKPKRVVVLYSKGLLHTGSHAVDLLGFLLGKAEFDRLLEGEGAPYLQDPTPSFVLKYGNAEAYFFAKDYNDYEIFDIDLLFERGRVRISDFGETVRYYRSRRKGKYPVLAKEKEVRGWGRYFLRLLDGVAGSVGGNARPACSGKDALAALRTCNRVLRARLESGRKARA